MISRLILGILVMAVGWQGAYGMEWLSVVPVRVSVKNPTTYTYMYTIFGKDEVIKPTECIHYHGIIDGDNPVADELKITFRPKNGNKIRFVHYVNGIRDGMRINFSAFKKTRTVMEIAGVIDETPENTQDLSLKKSIVAIELDLSKDSDFDRHCKIIPNDTDLFLFDKIVALDLDTFKIDQKNKLFIANTFLRCAQPLQGYKDGSGYSLPIEYQCYDYELKKSVNNLALVETAIAQMRRNAPKIVIERKPSSQEPTGDQKQSTDTLGMMVDVGLILWDIIKL